MSNETGATLTEQELFSEFIERSITSVTSFGRKAVRETYFPSDTLRIYGEYGELEDASELIVDQIAASEETENYLYNLAGAVENYAKDLRKVAADFGAFKAVHSTGADLGAEPEDQHSEAYRAWCDAYDEHERNPRFHAPEIEAA